jgi:hypothetical protein
MKLALMILSLCPSLVAAQAQEEFGDRWKVFRALTGEWEGAGTGEWGGSSVDANCQFTLNGRFLEMRTRAVYPASQKNSSGGVQEELAIVSFDNDRKTFVLRQFQGRGLVNQGVLDSISADGKTIQFTSEALENVPRGWRARVTYQVVNDRELIYRFEFAPPDKGFEPHSEINLKRTK